jgi:hypothetical protein
MFAERYGQRANARRPVRFRYPVWPAHRPDEACSAWQALRFCLPVVAKARRVSRAVPKLTLPLT